MERERERERKCVSQGVCVCDREIGGYLMYVIVLKPELMYKGERERDWW